MTSSLHDKNLAFGGVLGLAVSKLSVGVKGKFLLGEHIGFGPLLGFTDLRRLFRAADNIFCPSAARF